MTKRKVLLALGFSALLMGTANAQQSNIGPGPLPGVQGPVSATSGHIATFNGTSGKIIQDGGAIPTSSVLTNGTWTPTLLGSTTNPTVTYANQYGYYTKTTPGAGGVSQVCLYGFFNISAISGGSGNIELGGLPFAATNQVQYNALLSVNDTLGLTTATTTPNEIGWMILGASSVAPLFTVNTTLGTVNVEAVSAIGSSFQTRLSGCYESDS